MDVHYDCADIDGWRVEAEHANVPDEFSNAAGDIEVFRDGELVQAAEVKDKPSERSDLQHAVRKARENELGEYLYVVGAGFRDDSERQGAMRQIENAPIELILVWPDELIAQLKFVGETGRIRFVESVGAFSNEMRANETNKQDWKQVAEEMR